MEVCNKGIHLSLLNILIILSMINFSGRLLNVPRHPIVKVLLSSLHVLSTHRLDNLTSLLSLLIPLIILSILSILILLGPMMIMV